MNQQQRREILIEALLKERGACHEIEIPKSPEEQKADKRKSFQLIML